MCPDDDRRLKTVRFQSDTPQDVLDQARLDAEDSLADQESGTGQAPLTDAEQERIDWSEGRANVPHARSVKALAGEKGVSDWTAYYDPTLTVDEHREVMDRAAKEGGGKRREDTETSTEKAGRAARTAKSEECDHARGHCEHGNPDACEFLQETCGYSEEETRRLLSEDERPQDDSEQVTLEYQGETITVTPQVAGALRRSWQGYKGATSAIEQALQQIREARTQAEQAMLAINRIRDQHDQDPLPPNRLHSLMNAVGELPNQHRATSLHEFVARGGPDRSEVLDVDDQRTLGGDRANDQARLAGGEQGEQGQGEPVEQTAENPGGIMADQRASTDTGPSEEGTEQQIPDEFAVAEGGQETL